MKSIITLAATLTLAITLTLTACEEKKKQDGTTTTAPEPAAEAATQEAATQEAAAEKPTEKGGGSFTDERDGKTYKTVKIGSQVWMAENLNTEIGNSKCYDDDDDNCKKYGQLYDWETAKTACPSGWHLPSKEEWQTLVNFAGGKETVAKYLNATSGWKKGNGEDKYGFSLLPGGLYQTDTDYGEEFADIGFIAMLWTSTASDISGFPHIIFINYDSIIDSSSGYLNYLSVRCIQN